MPPTLPLRPRTPGFKAVLALAIGALLVGMASRPSGQASRNGWTVVAWNNLGMHCMDADFGVFSILPPYNTIQAQVVDPEGRLISDPGRVTLTYRAVADPTGSINTTSTRKSNFWTYAGALFGTVLPVDVGLLGHNMPGTANPPQPMVFDSGLKWFIAEGIPITPYDDAGKKNYYPMMEVTAKDAAGATVASTRIVVPVSDEMDCSTCHASGSGDAARPANGWVFGSDPQRDFRLNILRRHDDGKLTNATYQAALGAKGYLAAGLYATAIATPAQGGKPVLCAHCHRSEALAGSGFAGVRPLTAAIHTLHAGAVDPLNGRTLDSTENRSACYRCHPGSETRCLRGVMGSAVAADGTMAMQCQNCHGRMSDVGAVTRTGWLDEPTCQQCHSGTATSNSGQIRFGSVFDASGRPRVAADLTFATSHDTPAPGLSLYRFSKGHGGLQCSACHGATHAEYPSSHENDNVQSVALQGHVGTIAECATCHAQVPQTTSGGPHGMHPVGASWVSAHKDAAERGAAPCATCHGADYRGTVLSRSFAVRTLTTELGTKTLFRGAQVGCYMCHNGPSSESRTSNRNPVASDQSVSTAAGVPVSMTLQASDPDGNALTFRIVSQPLYGTVSLTGRTATYFPFAGFTGNDRFTFAAWDGSIDSNLASVSMAVNAQVCTLTTTAAAPVSATAGQAVTFTSTATPANCAGAVTYAWTFGDGTPGATSQNVTHTYASAGTFSWTMTASADGVASTKAGTLVVSTAAASAPAISRVRALRDPFGIEITGANFRTGVMVFVGTSSQAWSNTRRDSSTRLVLSGSGLSALFPVGKSVSIRVQNPDGRSASTRFTRSR
jgi:hypothetical protein